MSFGFCSLGMVLLSLGLMEMGYGPKTPVWWFIILGIAIYSIGWAVKE